MHYCFYSNNAFLNCFLDSLYNVIKYYKTYNKQIIIVLLLNKENSKIFDRICFKDLFRVSSVNALEQTNGNASPIIFLELHIY